MRILLSILLILVFVPDWSGEARLPLLPRDPSIRATQVTLRVGDTKQTRLGGLTFLGGVALDGPGHAFGGFSAMAVDGDRFMLLSDGGNIVSFTMGADWTARAVRFAELPAGPGKGWRKQDRDSESLTTDPATGQIWVGFERANAIWRYERGFARAQGHATPPALSNWSSNGGAEAMVRLRDGRFIVLAEDRKGDAAGTVRGIMFSSDPVAAPRRGFAFSYRPPRGFKPTDMAELPDGRIAVLNRRFALPLSFTATLTLIPRRAIRRGAIVTGREVARFEGPVLHDNFEALAVVREGRDTILWIASDDNQLFLQRSLLLKFRLNR
ncbi:MULTISPECIES: esterase-like activity of phytase family protein [unclassified Sphingomonas]|uniref:esterase-like activity of phytase family protein n=1 Tax=unclassified Sphingomonas TaxID=196159 RepID=UPI00083556B5|nr:MULTISPECIES: esterase-like activity of phytase family protein [unclassified Sphingomonas]